MFIYSLIGHVATITQLENMAALEVILLIAAAEHGHCILSKRQSLLLVSSCINMFLVQRNKKGLILALYDSQELILWY